MRVLLFGNPNVGKSVVFSRLTGAAVITSNYPGTTVEYAVGRMRVGGVRVDVIDVPGTYSLSPTSRAEEVAARILDEANDDDIVVNVVDSTNLERSLNLTLQLMKRRKPTVVALNLWDEAKHTGVEIDAAGLEQALGVPCVPLVALTGEGVRDLVAMLPSAKPATLDVDEEERWREVGRIVADVQTLTHKHHTLSERIGDMTLRPVTGLPIALAVLLVAFELIRVVGESAITHVLDPLFDTLWTPVVARLSAALGSSGFVHGVLIGSLFDGAVDYGQSFGLLTTGLYVPLAAVMPYVFVFYLVLSLLEDSGYLPRLAVLADTIMHRLGLHGMGIIPMLLGLGCNVPGALATRIMESRRERFIAMALMATCMPCMAQTSMIIGLVGRHGVRAFVPIVATLAVTWVVLGLILARTVVGESPEILIDIPPYRWPYLRGLLAKLGMRMVWFLKEAVPWVLAGVLIINILYLGGIMDVLAWAASPVIVTVLGLPEEAVGGLVIGFLRKDIAVGMLAPLDMGLRQSVVASVVLTMYFPCVATFAVMIRELGARDTAKTAGVMVSTALVAGAILNLAMWGVGS